MKREERLAALRQQYSLLVSSAEALEGKCARLEGLREEILRERGQIACWEEESPEEFRGENYEACCRTGIRTLLNALDLLYAAWCEKCDSMRQLAAEKRRQAEAVRRCL